MAERQGLASNVANYSSGSGLFSRITNTWDEARKPGNALGSAKTEEVTNADGTKTTTTSEGLGGYLSTGAKVLEGVGAIMAANNAKKELALAREKFGFEKAAANRNAINQGKAYNEELGRRADVGLALGGNAISDAQRTSTLDKVAGQRVSESAIQ